MNAHLFGRHAIVLSLIGAGCLHHAAPLAPGEGPVERSDYLEVDGARLYVEVRGADRRAPALLWLHGGPGGAERPLFRYFNGDLEEQFVVVYWDQRGAGRSFDARADPARLTIARHLADMDFVVDHVRRSLDREKVFTIGHSWGSALGLLYARAHPDKVCAFIGINPVVSTREGQRAQTDFVLREALRREDDDVVERVAQIGPPPFESATQVLEMEKLVARYGGVFHEESNRLWVMIQVILRGLLRPWELPRFIRANNVSLEAMNDELVRLDLRRSVPSVDLPAVFLLGRHDRHTSPELATSYLRSLDAPWKREIWFESSAHNIPFEEPRLFRETVVRELRSAGTDCENPVRGAGLRARRGPQGPTSGDRP